MNPTWNWIIWIVFGGALIWSFARGWPSRRLREFAIETTIAAPAERVWNAVCEHPGDPESAPFHARIVSVHEVGANPPAHDYVIDVNGYGTHHSTIRIESLEERTGEYLLTRIAQIDDKPFPFGQEHRQATTLAVGPDGTRVMLQWSGETATVGQFKAMRRRLRNYLRQAKLFCETGRAPPRRSGLSLPLGLALSGAAVATFLLWLGWLGGLLLTGVLILHEVGHWVAMKLTGQPAPRLILIPFFGGAALANHPHKTLFHDAFCALMGPGLSAVASVAFIVGAYAFADGVRADLAVDPRLDIDQRLEEMRWFFQLGAMLGFINLLQMVPLLPLDGGQVLRAIMQSFHAAWARRALLGLAAAGTVGFALLGEPLLAGLMALGGLQAWHMSADRPRSKPMTGGGVMVIVLGYLLAFAAHATAAWAGWGLARTIVITE